MVRVIFLGDRGRVDVPRKVGRSVPVIVDLVSRSHLVCNTLTKCSWVTLRAVNSIQTSPEILARPIRYEQLVDVRMLYMNSVTNSLRWTIYPS